MLIRQSNLEEIRKTFLWISILLDEEPDMQAGVIMYILYSPCSVNVLSCVSTVLFCGFMILRSSLHSLAYCSVFHHGPGERKSHSNVYKLYREMTKTHLT